MSVLVRLPFPAALAILAAGTAAGVGVSVRTGTFLWFVVTLAAVAAFGVVYLREYARLPGPEDEPVPPRASRNSSAMFAGEPEPPKATVNPPSAEPEVGPVEVDAFDPEYDPVAEADELETHPSAAPPEPPEP